MSTTTGHIFNVEEAHGKEAVECETTAAEARIEAPTSEIAREVEDNAEHVHEAAEEAADVARHKGPSLTGTETTISSTDKLQQQAWAKTNAAATEGKHDVDALKAAGADYVEQAKEVVEHAKITAQQYLPNSLGGTAGTTHEAVEKVKDVVQGAFGTSPDTKVDTTASRKVPSSYTQYTMDSFISIAKQGYEAYESSQSNVRKTGGEEYNSPDNSAPGSGGRTNINHEEAAHRAQQHGSGDKDLFHSALGFVGKNQDEHESPVNEEEVTDAHRQAYHEGNASNLSAGSLGSAAAMQVLHQFTSGGKGGGSQTELISMAMAEATKLFDKAGGGSSGNKQDAVNGAAMTVMKLLVQSKFGGGGSFFGGGNSGGISGLLSLASKFA